MIGSCNRSRAPCGAEAGDTVAATLFGPVALMLYPGPSANTLPGRAWAADSARGPFTDSAACGGGSAASPLEATVGLLICCEGPGSGVSLCAGATGGGAASGTEVSGAGGGAAGASEVLPVGVTDACLPDAGNPAAGPAMI